MPKQFYPIQYVTLTFLSILFITIPHTVTASQLNFAPMRFFNAELQTYSDAPGIASDIHIDINGTIARTTVTQYFLNDTEDWQEGVYTYPLPDNASVDSLTMMVGNKRIIGFVHEKQQAKKIYEAAKAKGQAASLAEQHRPNIFKNSVANIPPQSVIAVEIQYQYPIHIDNYVFSLRTPLAITPRYNNFTVEDFMILVSASKQDWAQKALEETLTEIHLSDFDGGTNPVSLSVNFTPGFKIRNLKSTSHVITTEENKGTYQIRTSKDILPGEQDFILSWEPEIKDKPIISSYREELDGEIYSHILILPPKDVQDIKAPSPKRHITFILDTSGSMDGPSIKQARKSLVHALQDLTDQDHFNVIEFNSQHRKLFDAPLSGTQDNIQKAIYLIGELEADGGTNMVPALQEAFAEKDMPGTLRQIVFITDGAIGYEAEMMQLIKADAGRARLFAIGIGSAPNAHLMRSLAEAGRGSFTFIGDVKEIKQTLSSLFEKMKTPAITNLELILPDGIEGDVIPAQLPDLLAGQPVSVALKTNRPLHRIDITGNKGNRPYKISEKIKDQKNAEGISKIYARQKIHGLQFQDPYGQNVEIKSQIIALGTHHQIMSKYTSFVAVDEDIIRPQTEQLITKTYDPSLPKGWQDGRLEGRKASKLYQELMLKQQSENNMKKNIHLPQTATGYQMTLMIGLLLLLCAGGLIIRQKRQIAG